MFSAFNLLSVSVYSYSLLNLFVLDILGPIFIICHVHYVNIARRRAKIKGHCFFKRY